MHNTIGVDWSEFLGQAWGGAFLQAFIRDDDGAEQCYGHYIESVRATESSVVFKLTDRVYQRRQGAWCASPPLASYIVAPMYLRPARLLIRETFYGLYCFKWPNSKLAIVYPPGIINDPPPDDPSVVG